MEHIKNELKNKSIRLTKIEIKRNDIFYFTVYKERIFFIKNLNGLLPSSLLEDAILISDYISEDKIKDKIKTQISDKDMENIYSKVNLMAILWDLYIIGIHLLDNDKKYLQEEISKVEKDKFAARKIIIEDSDEDRIVQDLIDIFEPSQKLEQIIKGNEWVSSKNVWDNIVKTGDENSIKIENVNDLESLEKYLNNVKIKVDKLNKKLDGDEYFEN